MLKVCNGTLLYLSVNLSISAMIYWVRVQEGASAIPLASLFSVEMVVKTVLRVPVFPRREGFLLTQCFQISQPLQGRVLCSNREVEARVLALPLRLSRHSSFVAFALALEKFDRK